MSSAFYPNYYHTNEAKVVAGLAAAWCTPSSQRIGKALVWLRWQEPGKAIASSNQHHGDVEIIC
jgi:hypothetical protein